jgi:hypothetical protein
MKGGIKAIHPYIVCCINKENITSSLNFVKHSFNEKIKCIKDITPIRRGIQK